MFISKNNLQNFQLENLQKISNNYPILNSTELINVNIVKLKFLDSDLSYFVNKIFGYCVSDNSKIIPFSIFNSVRTLGNIKNLSMLTLSDNCNIIYQINKLFDVEKFFENSNIIAKNKVNYFNMFLNPNRFNIYDTNNNFLMKFIPVNKTNNIQVQREISNDANLSHVDPNLSPKFNKYNLINVKYEIFNGKDEKIASISMNIPKDKTDLEVCKIEFFSKLDDIYKKIVIIRGITLFGTLARYLKSL